MSANVLEIPPQAPPEAPPPPAGPWVRLESEGQEGPVTSAAAVHVVLIGSRRDCHLPIMHPNVSKMHCALINTGRAVLARDLISRSGTFVNDQPVGTAMLNAGSALRVGPVSVAFELLGDPPSEQVRPADSSTPDTPLTISIRGQSLPLAGSALVVGRRNTADVVVDTPDASLAHAIIFLLDGRPAIHDLGSRSGTCVNGQRVEVAWLPNGGEVEIGGERFSVSWDEAAEQVTGAAEQPESSPAATEPAAAGQAAATSMAGGPVSAVPTTLDDLEQMIAAVHDRLAGARNRLDERTLELDERAAQLVREQAEAQERLAAITESEQRAEARQAQLSQAEQDLTKRCAALDEQLSKLSEEQGALQQRRTELEAMAAQVDEGRRALEAERGVVAQQRSEFDDARGAFEREKQALDEARESCRKTEEELQGRAGEIAAQSSQLAQQRAELETSQSELAAAQAAQADSAARLQESQAHLEEREAALKSGLGELLEREATLAERERALDAREAAIAAHESQNAEIDQRIRQFKTALMRAGEMFANTDSATAPAETEPAEAARSEAGTPLGQESPAAGSTGEVSPGAVSEASALKRSQAEGLPAPIVDEPLFSGGAFPPSDWPPKLRERFRVLRRMSRKTDEELAQQVWDERDRVLAASDTPREDAKRKRRFWGN